MKLLFSMLNKDGIGLFLKVILLVTLSSLISCSNKEGGSKLFGIFSSSGKNVAIPEGFFIMGSEKGNTDEQPERNIYTSTFLIDQTEVSKGEYADCVDSGICNFPLEGKGLVWGKDGKDGEDNLPINGVSWFDARNYCQFVEKRLPTEAEWEKAASWKNDVKYKYSNGEYDIDCASANFKNIGDELCQKTELAKVGSFQKEVNGTYDMNGNLWEWVQDWYTLSGLENLQSRDPQGPESGLLKVNKGGSYLSSKNYIRSSFRGANSPVARSKDIGFRCAQSINKKK